IERQDPLVVAAPGKDARSGVAIDPAIGLLTADAPAYPVWSYVTGLLAAPPAPFQIVRWWVAILDVAALAVAVWFARRALAELGAPATTLGVAIVLAPVANLFTLSAGQYGLLINGLVIAAVVLDLKGHWFAAGVSFGLAFVKPQTAGLYALVFLLSR